MFSGKKKKVHGAHRSFQTGMLGCQQHILVRKTSQPCDGRVSYGLKLIQQGIYAFFIVISLIGLSIGKVGRSQHIPTLKDVVKPPLPQWFQINEMADVFLNRPRFIIPGYQHSSFGITYLVY